MSGPILNRDQSRRVDRVASEEFGIPGILLMENAGRGVVDLIVRLHIDGPVVVCCGKGNNAGDGFVIARHLAILGYDPRVLLWADPGELSGDAAVNFQVIRRTGIPIETFPASQFVERWEENQTRLLGLFESADWIVDALLGTGAKGEPRPPLDRVIDLNNRAGCRKLAVDVPSGLDCDTGAASSQTVRADHTATFVAAKKGFLAVGAGEYLGQVHVLGIGSPPEVLERILAEGP